MKWFIVEKRTDSDFLTVVLIGTRGHPKNHNNSLHCDIDPPGKHKIPLLTTEHHQKVTETFMVSNIFSRDRMSTVLPESDMS